MLWQPPLPDPYLRMSDEDLARRIRDRKAQLGDRLLVLGHHYSRTTWCSTPTSPATA
jgi:quinolinate synthase